MSAPLLLENKLIMTSGLGVIFASKELIFGGLILVIVLAIAENVIATRYFHPLSQFPGPFFASISRLWIVYYNLLGKEYLKEYDLHKKYGIKKPPSIFYL